MSSLLVFLVVCAFVLSIVFSASEAALLTMTTSSFNRTQQLHPTSAALLEKLLARPRRLMVTIMVSNMVVNGLMVAVISNLFVGWYGLFRGLALSVVVLTALVALFAEIFPKVLATRYPAAVAVFTCYPVFFASFVVSPFIVVAEGMLRICLGEGDDTSPERSLTEDELRSYLMISQSEGVLAASEGKMISSVFKFSDTLVREVMTPRTEIDALPEGAGLAEVLAFVRKVPRSRIPVYREHLDEITGILHTKELLPFLAGTKDKADFDLSRLTLEPYFVPEVMKCDELLKELRQRRLALAIVVDEYGGTAGIVSIEDLLEEIFGEIQDENDREEALKVVSLPGGGWSLDARLRVEEVVELLSIPVPEGEYDTVGGFVFDRIGRLPSEGDEVREKDFLFRVARMEGRRLSRIDVLPLGAAEGDLGPAMFTGEPPGSEGVSGTAGVSSGNGRGEAPSARYERGGGR